MTLVVNVDGVDMAGNIEIDEISLSYGADSEPHLGGFTIHDPEAAIDVTDDIRGLRQITIDETACTDAPRLWTGFVEERRVKRGTSEKTDGARVIEVDTLDANEVFGKRLLWEANAKRPAETVEDRLDWIMDSDHLGYPDIWQIFDNGEIDFSAGDLDNPMDEADYRGQKYGDVLQDILGAVTLEGDFYVYFDQAAEELSLHIGRATTTVGTSTLRLSNDPDDWDFDGSVVLNTPTITFPIVIDHEFKRNPETAVYSRVRLEWAGGVSTKGLASTANTYTSRGINVPNTLVHSAATASAWLDRFLDAHDTEADSIKVTTILPDTHVGLIDAGQRLSCKFVQLEPEGYHTFHYWRVKSVTRRMPMRTDLYYVDLELVRGATGLSGGGGGGSSGGSTPGDFPHVPPPPPSGGGSEDWCCTFGADGEGCETSSVAETNRYTIPGGHHALVSVEWVVTPNGHVGAAWIAGQIHVTWDGGTTGDNYASVVSHGVGGGGYSSNICWDTGGTTYCSTTAMVTAGYPQVELDLASTDPTPIDHVLRIDGIKAFRQGGGSPWPGAEFCARITQVRDATTLAVIPNEVIPDDNQEVGPNPGQWVYDETPDSVTPSGGITDVVTQWPYATGSLRVKVDDILISSASIVEDDPGAGTFHLTWQIDSDETVTVSYQGI